MFITSTVFGGVITEQLDNVSVTVVVDTPLGTAQGSGVVKVRNGVGYVWTAGHVVADGRKTRTVVDSATKSTKTLVYFDDVKVVKDIVENGRLVEVVSAYAEVIRYSGPENGEDLALLRLRKTNFVTSSVDFSLTSEVPEVGTDLIHVGSMHGHFGSNSFTTGVFSHPGRILGNVVFDQTSVIATHGSSGGGVFFRSNGKYMGMLVRGSGEGFNLVVPVRRMIAWAKRSNAYWAMDDTIAVNDDPTYSVENYLEAPSVNPLDMGIDSQDNESYEFQINKTSKLHE